VEAASGERRSEGRRKQTEGAVVSGGGGRNGASSRKGQDRQDEISNQDSIVEDKVVQRHLILVGLPPQRADLLLRRRVWP
jgi:hypothetical protein